MSRKGKFRLLISLLVCFVALTACPVPGVADGGAAGGGTATTGGGGAAGGGTAGGGGGGGATGGGGGGGATGGGAAMVRQSRDVVSGSARVTAANVVMDVQVGHAISQTPASGPGVVVSGANSTQP